jgi:hypothetical protein
MIFWECLGMNLVELVVMDIGVKGIDAFIKEVNMHIGAIVVERGGGVA